MRLQLFGCGSAAQVTTTQEKKGQYLSINLGFALGVTFAVFMSRGVSGEEPYETCEGKKTFQPVRRIIYVSARTLVDQPKCLIPDLSSYLFSPIHKVPI